jgi:hypothetical protein
MAPEGYVFNGRFPTVKSAWVTVTGPDVSTPAKHACRGLRSPRTLAMLRAALRDHPDLGAALTGHLSDSWAQQDNAG